MPVSQSERNLRWRTKYPERHKANHNDWVAENREKRNAYMREWWAKAKAADPEKYKAMARKSAIKRKYGITQERYDEMLRLQGGHCALCDKTPEQERDGVLRIDHCHSTGRVRGLLCDKHNLAIGRIGDADCFRRALAYVSKDTGV